MENTTMQGINVDADVRNRALDVTTIDVPAQASADPHNHEPAWGTREADESYLNVGRYS